MNYEQYLGVDVSRSAVKACKKIFRTDSTKRFQTYNPLRPLKVGMFDATVSLEVLMHVIDEDAFVATLDNMFSHARKLVILHAPLFELISYRPGSPERHRELFPYLEKYDFEIADIVVHPSTTLEGRRAGTIGDMCSDFVILLRNA